MGRLRQSTEEIQEILDKVESGEVGSADWNASEGESGYIKHRTHYFDLSRKFRIAPSEWKKEYSDDGRLVKLSYDTGTDGDFGVVVMKGKSSSLSFNKKIDLIPDIVGYISLSYPTHYGFLHIVVELDSADSDDYNLAELSQYDFAVGYISNDIVEQLDESFIPSEIARQDAVDELREETAALWDNLDHGKFPNLVAGDLYGHGESAEAEFSFRASGGKSIKDGTAYVKEIHGNSVVWNQLCKRVSNPASVNGITIIDNGDSYTISGTAEADVRIPISEFFENINTHIYCMIGCPQNGSISTYYLEEEYSGWYDSGNGYIGSFSKTSNQKHRLGIIVKSGVTISSPLTFRPKVFNLTKMFGAGHEPSTLEDFYRLLPSNIDINEYNEGEVIPFRAEGIKSVGDNAWDEEWEVGSIVDNTGDLILSSSTIRSKNYIKAIGGNEYYFGYFGNATTWCRVHYYDAEKKWIGSIAKTLNAKSFIPPLNCAYMKFRMGDQYGTTYKNDITISLYHSGWKAEIDNTYKPYWADTLMLDARIKEAFPNGMYSAGNAYDEIRFNKETNKWEAVKRIGEYELGEIKFYKDSSKDFYKIEAPITMKEGNNYLCANYSNSLSYELGTIVGINLMLSGRGTTHIRICDLAYTDNTSFNAAVKGIKIYYELAEPIVTPLGEFEMDYKVADFGTEEIIGSEPSAPFNGRTIYQFNAVDQIRENYNEIERIKAALAKAGISIDL